MVMGWGGVLCPSWMGIWNLYPLDLFPFVLGAEVGWEEVVMDEWE